MKIGVLYGGVSGERDVSLSTGEGIMNALDENGHEVIGVDFHPERMGVVLNLNVDLVFIGLHGKHGEDGKIQGLLDMLGIPYVGSGVLASALAMDKAKSKQLFHLNGLYTAQSMIYYRNRYEHVGEMTEHINGSFTPPFVIKPNQEGSTLGFTIVKEPAEVEPAILKALTSDQEILVEAYIAGREVTVPVVGAKGNEQALPVIEIIPKNDYYDFESKYEPGGSEHLVPAPLSEELRDQLQAHAVKAHQLLGCDVYSRVDFMIDQDENPVILEVNTLPGMTPTSLFPDAAQKIGWSYNEMVEQFVNLSRDTSTIGG
ncbi:D-alanine--D-alanine ligase [Thalassobacillus sp. CUG 92003]|uniref:D-alanine--D-alanine ligase family protein n=1 Tax=Thalassobacillus sp. CUG 92003 TaxID=2736641 RepID=UPI0015E74F65|nr:D-alanine--D-alanine ligase [Thalassobacillus sp. CUG 92003]